MADSRHLAMARELEERDARVAAALAVVRELETGVAEVRAHTEGIAAIRASYPFDAARVDEAILAARAELEAREAELADAERELARAKEGEQEAAARRALTRATDAAGAARRKVARLREDRERLTRDSEQAEAELPRLQERARELGVRIAELPHVTSVDTVPDQPASLIEWSSRARAALFVAAGGLESERERLVREASELCAAALGDSALLLNVALVRERIEREAGADA